MAGELADLVEEEGSAVGQLEAPLFLRARTVKAPGSWPNSSDSMRLSGSAPQFTLTNGLSARGEL